MATKPITPAARHAQRYQARTEPWDAQQVYYEFVRRIQEATGVTRERAHGLAKANAGRFGVTLDGDLIPPPDDRGAADPFARTIQRIMDTVDAEGREPEPKSVAEIAALRKQSGIYAM